jgi:hypothetical protein
MIDRLASELGYVSLYTPLIKRPVCVFSSGGEDASSAG